ncbi:hypothetical protein HII17_17905 [Thalassotalea sp. M1531]|uniref:Uncharacterized protein n=1 Tax=Thalassotalea algicola TaxID=2716224 RepID=A0A7Y0Q8N8_9GAMM|nr:hypothetical protein [Thalassotalea algicola]NMP33426.1 hypothetical protein [Thalassotalea algicola]
MELKQTENIKSFMFNSILGVIFAYISVVIFSFAAALPIPANVFEPIAQSSPKFAFAVLDLFTIGLPLAFTYFIFVYITRKSKTYVELVTPILLALPFFLLHSYFVILSFPSSRIDFYLASTSPKYILLIVIVGFITAKKYRQN